MSLPRRILLLFCILHFVLAGITPAWTIPYGALDFVKSSEREQAAESLLAADELWLNGARLVDESPS